MGFGFKFASHGSGLSLRRRQKIAIIEFAYRKGRFENGIMVCESYTDQQLTSVVLS